MFLSVNSLVTQYGIDETIALFFVDREPPKDNLYWEDKLLYLRPQPGYLFFPMITDLFYRAGIPKETLLQGRFVPVIESICHQAAREEMGITGKTEALQQCMELVQPVTDNTLMDNIAGYLRGEKNFISDLATPFPALHRGDLFLFSLCVLEAGREKQGQLVQAWFALISILLLMDDAEDFETDKHNHEENAFIESGGNLDGFLQIKQLVAKNLDCLSKLNKHLAGGLHIKFLSVAEQPFIKEFLNA